MTASLSDFARDTPPAEIWKALEHDGAAIVHDFLPGDLVARLAARFGRELDAVPWGNSDSGAPDRFFGFRTKRLHGLLGREPAFEQALLHPLARAMCEHFLRPQARHEHLSTAELMAIGPGEVPQALHRDADSWDRFPDPRPEILVSVNLALTDFRADNGATVVIPGSQRWPRDRRPTDADPRARAVMPRGAALLYTGNVWHGGGGNDSDETRIGCYWGYTLSWLQPLENHLITSGHEAIAAATEPVQRLLDFTPSGWQVQP